MKKFLDNYQEHDDRRENDDGVTIKPVEEYDIDEPRGTSSRNRDDTSDMDEVGRVGVHSV